MHPFSDTAFKSQFYRLIQSRKSIRQFKPEPVDRQIIQRILTEAAVHAPSGKNRQNWRFFVLQGEKKDQYLKYSQKSWDRIREVLHKRLKPSLYSFTERFFYTLGQAPVVILVYSENTPEEKYLTSVGSVYMAVQNINLACFVEGLGCCTMGAPLEIKDEVNDFLQKSVDPSLKIGEDIELLCAIAVGFPDHNPPKAPRQLNGRVHWIE
jgi:nitroreductase